MKNKKSGGELLIKIATPILIIAIVGAIWAYKQSSEKVVGENDLNDEFALTTDEIDLVKLKSYGLPVMIQFGADSCAPCKLMQPILRKLNQELRGKAVIKYVDVWKNQNAATGFPLEVIPTQFFFDGNGKPYTPADPEKMKMNLFNSKDTNEHIYTAHQGGLSEAQILEVLYDMGMEK